MQILQIVATLLSLTIALVSMITGYYLQKDARKIRELELKTDKLEEKNESYKRNLLKALYAIKGYQSVEEDIAKKNKKTISQYRTNIRKSKPEYFKNIDTKFIQPGRISQFIKELEN